MTLRRRLPQPVDVAALAVLAAAPERSYAAKGVLVLPCCRPPGAAPLAEVRRRGADAVEATSVARRPRTTTEPFLVLDCNEFSVWCRACPWRSPSYATVAEARQAFAAHVCSGSACWSAPVRLRVALGELAALRLRRCVVCARVGLRRFRPVNPAMPLAWVKTWVCADRAACRRRQAAQPAPWDRGWGRHRLA